MMNVVGLYIMEQGKVRPGTPFGRLYGVFDTEDTLKAYMSKRGDFQYVGKGANSVDTYRLVDSIREDILWGIQVLVVMTKDDLK